MKGGESTVDVAFIAPADFGNVDIEQLDRIRTEMKGSLSELDHQLWMNIVFANDRQWS